MRYLFFNLIFEHPLRVLTVTIRNQPSYAGKKISRVIREIFCNNKEASA